MPDKKTILGTIAGLSLLAILFTEQGAETWRTFLFIGLIFGFGWFLMN
ncbi:MAG: hypothetical protein KC516_03590 [Nanoarchaeota archaeon]|nr:hypothetical protein [Nanoarchaeota archaeon]